jgi:hypothetical protein
MPNLQVKTLLLCGGVAATLLACAEPVGPDAALPTDAAPPPFNLTLGPAPVPGGTISATLSGAPAGATWALIAANGGIAMDQGLCPPVLAGGCMDILDGTLGYRLVGSGTVPAGGSVAWSATLPGTIQPGAYQLQAVLTAPQPAESNPVEFTIGSSCPTLGEPNDDATGAWPLTADITGLAVCPTDVDWFTVDLPPGTALSVTANLQPGDGDVDLELLDERGFLLDGSYKLGVQEEVLWMNTGTAMRTVYVVAWAVTDPQRDGVRYDLDMEQLQQSACVDDAFEDDDLPGQAHAITAGQYAGHQACAGDRDWFYIDLRANDELRVGIDEDSSLGDVDIELYDINGTPLTVGAVDPATYFALTTQRVYIATDLVSDDLLGGGNAYTLDARVSQVQVCSDDTLEPNDNGGVAATVTAGNTTALTQCADDDWYALTLQQGDRVDVTLSFSINDGDIDAEVYSPAGRVIGGGTSGASDELFSFTASTAGVYKMRFYLYSDTGGTVIDGAAYDMEIDVR